MVAQARPIRKLLVANRGEIAVRILDAARELGLETYAVFTDNDASHTYSADHAIKLPGPNSYNDASALADLVKQHEIDAVHPGYGFLSESADFARRVVAETGAVFVGPGADILDQTADKLEARMLAQTCNVPTLPALLEPTDDVDRIHEFALKVGYPVMIKALDGGGGRGIRLVLKEVELPNLMARAIEESPSRQVFAEKACAEGFRHVEIQIVGDVHGNIIHLNERDCSIQRRYQKVVEMAPSLLDRRLATQVIQSASAMAKKIGYVSLGTFEFLVNPETAEYYFLEVNPRLQVEHTVTESIAMTDLVQAQLRIAQGCSIEEAGLHQAESPSPLFSLQLRVTAEDAAKDWSLSVGRIQSHHFPSGNGVRVDTHLVQGVPAIVSADFDSLIAKLIITAPTWQGVLRKAARALEDTRIIGIQTNLSMLRAIVNHDDLAAGRCDTAWLRRNHEPLLASASHLTQQQDARASSSGLFKAQSASSSTNPTSSSLPLFRKGDAWTISLEPKTSSPSSPQSPNKSQQQQQQHIEITKVLRNDFPTTFSAEISLTPHTSQLKPQAHTLHLQSTSTSASAFSSNHRRGSPNEPTHVIIPFAGKLVEVLVDEGDVVQKGDVVCVVKQMKMELEVRAARAGVVTWVTDAADDEDVAEGTLAAIVEEEEEEEEEEEKRKLVAKL